MEQSVYISNVLSSSKLLNIPNVIASVKLQSRTKLTIL